MEGYKMSEEISRLPPQVQERLLRLQQLQQTLQSVLAQKQQVEIELTEIEQAVEDMTKVKEEVKEEKKVNETHKLSILRALENMDAIIDTLSEGKVKKKVYTIK